MKLRPFLRTFSSTPAAINERDKLKSEPAEKSIRRKQALERRSGINSVVVELNGKTMEDCAEAPDKPDLSVEQVNLVC